VTEVAAGIAVIVVVKSDPAAASIAGEVPMVSGETTVAAVMAVAAPPVAFVIGHGAAARALRQPTGVVNVEQRRHLRGFAGVDVAFPTQGKGRVTDQVA
jgi:hypothetical protein